MGVFLGSAIGTGVVGIGWIIFGSVALSANGRFEQAVADSTAPGASPDAVAAAVARGNDAVSTARTFRLLSDISMGVTIAGAAATVIIATQTNFRGNVEVAPTAFVGGTGLSVAGRF